MRLGNKFQGCFRNWRGYSEIAYQKYVLLASDCPNRFNQIPFVDELIGKFKSTSQNSNMNNCHHRNFNTYCHDRRARRQTTFLFDFFFKL